MLDTIRMESPIGGLFISSKDDLITEITPDERPVTAGNQLLERAVAELSEYFAGERRSFTLPLELSGTRFQRDVLKGMLSVAYGETISYAELARRCGHERAYQAVGSACGRNRILILIPCHRITASHGIGGFAYGLEVKKKLLSLENVLSFSL